MKTYQWLAILSMFFAGLTSVIAKMGIKNVSGDTGLAIRTCIVFFVIWVNLWAFGHHKELGQLTSKDMAFLAISGLTTSLSWIFYYKAIKVGPVSEVALIDKSSIIITLILSFMLLGEQWTWKMFCGACLILSGIVVLMMK